MIDLQATANTVKQLFFSQLMTERNTVHGWSEASTKDAC